MSLENDQSWPPIHDERRLKATSPKDLKKVFELFPLDKGYIDWLSSKGGQLNLCYYLEADRGAVEYNLPDSIRICFSPKASIEEANLVIAHELVHAAIPTINVITKENLMDTVNNKGEYDAWEDAIEEIAVEYANNPDFMDYVRQSLPRIISRR